MSPFALQFPDIDPVAITVFGRPIYWYAIMYPGSAVGGQMNRLNWRVD